MSTFRQRVLANRTRRFISTNASSAVPFVGTTAAVKADVAKPAPSKAALAKPAAAQTQAAVAAQGPWQAIEEGEAQRPFVVIRTDLAQGPEYLKSQNGRKRCFGSLAAAATAAEVANREGV